MTILLLISTDNVTVNAERCWKLSDIVLLCVVIRQVDYMWHLDLICQDTWKRKNSIINLNFEAEKKDMGYWSMSLIPNL